MSKVVTEAFSSPVPTNARDLAAGALGVAGAGSLVIGAGCGSGSLGDIAGDGAAEALDC